MNIFIYMYIYIYFICLYMYVFCLGASQNPLSGVLRDIYTFAPLRVRGCAYLRLTFWFYTYRFFITAQTYTEPRHPAPVVSVIPHERPYIYIYIYTHTHTHTCIHVGRPILISSLVMRGVFNVNAPGEHNILP